MEFKQVNIHYPGPVWAGDVIIELLNVCYPDGPMIRGNIERGFTLYSVFIEFGYDSRQSLDNHFVAALAKMAGVADMTWDITNGNEVNFYVPKQPQHAVVTPAGRVTGPGGFPVWLGIEIEKTPGTPPRLPDQGTYTEALQKFNKAIQEFGGQLAAAVADVGTAMGKLAALLLELSKRLEDGKKNK